MTRIRFYLFFLLVWSLTLTPLQAQDPQVPVAQRARAAMRKAATYYRTKVATHGGYVYHYSLDLKTRWGEGLATEDQIWVQPPGTPTVGMAYVKAYQATRDRFYLDAAVETAEALAYGQLKSGGWTNCIDFNPRGKRTALYRNGKGRGKNNSSLDDGQTQSALRCLIQVDHVLNFNNETIHKAAMVGLDALLKAQFPNGAFPQVWTGPVADQPIRKASYPTYDWRTEGRIKEYWNYYTLNDNVCGYLAETLIDAHKAYKDEKYLNALKKIGDFIILAQMPEPQTAWAQQYNYDMKPIWARKFEPAAIASDETQEALQTLMLIYSVTKDDKYLKPIPSALSWLKKSKLANGQLARFYELKSNKPLYMKRSGKVYTLTYDDSGLPSHYGWKISYNVDHIEKAYEDIQKNGNKAPLSLKALEEEALRVVQDLDAGGRWVSVMKDERLVGQPKIRQREKYLSSAVFSQNVEILSAYLHASRK